MSAVSLASLAGTSPTDIQAIERGDLAGSLAHILSIADALGVHPGTLFGRPDQDALPVDGLKARESNDGSIILSFRYDQHDAAYAIPQASLAEYQSVIESLRVGLASKGRADAVADSLFRAVRLWPHANPSALWVFLINRAYCDRANHPEQNSQLNLEQSWKRTSGWALERVLVRHYGEYLRSRGIELLLGGKKYAPLFGKLDDPRLIPDKADVLAVRHVGGDMELMGVIHVKASIAERRTDDVPMSQALLEAGLLSAFWTMDGKSWPSATPENRGELGPALPASERSDKRRDFEESGHFSACFSYNANTTPTPNAVIARARIYVCDFNDVDDAFTRFLLDWA